MSEPEVERRFEMNCDHFWRTVELYGYGWISVCEHCGERESAEHSQECFDSAIFKHKPCICGAAGEFQKYEAGEQEETQP